MADNDKDSRFHIVGDGSGISPDETLHKEELQLALRNRGMPLEALRYSITPSTMHYLLIHFDVPHVNADEWRLKLGGLVSRPRTLSLDEIKSRPAVKVPVTMECAGNGRALLKPRPISQPWLVEAIGTFEWTGTPLKGILEEAGLQDEAVEILFTGLDKGVQGDEVQYYQRSLSIEEATRDDVLLVFWCRGGTA
jgi:DMSO/TMAO reductase YedYZ molybdopterin-dependent catalytic subunit